MKLKSSISKYVGYKLDFFFLFMVQRGTIFPNLGRKACRKFPNVFSVTFSHLVILSKIKLKYCVFFFLEWNFKVLNFREMAFIHLDVRCLYAILICTAFGSTMSSNSEIKGKPTMEF